MRAYCHRRHGAIADNLTGYDFLNQDSPNWTRDVKHTSAGYQSPVLVDALHAQGVVFTQVGHATLAQFDAIDDNGS
eukprot:847600-Karenia_brevis.AAC.1